VYHDWDKFKRKFYGDIDVYFSSWSHRWVDIDEIKPKLVIYDSLDMFPANQSQELNMVDRSDAILATTKKIMEFHEEHGGNKPIHLCENGCFYSRYSNTKYDIPFDIKDLPKPWLLFSGALAIGKDYGWVDYDLLKEIAGKYTVIVVGMPWGAEPEQLTELKKKNLYIAGPKSYETLQAYYSCCDVNLLPFLRGQTADYSFPLKMVEGCVHGKICVSTDIPVAVNYSKKYPNAVFTSSTRKTFVNNIEKALSLKRNEKTADDCKAMAMEHDWSTKISLIDKVIQDGIKAKVGAIV
jgi:glycosyltransferase involved in cell wall biosynthesis